MSTEKNYNQTDVLVIGAGPAGLSAAITLKSISPDLDVCVIDKARKPGQHNLSGAIIKKESLQNLFDQIPNKDIDLIKNSIVVSEVKNDNVRFFLGKGISIPVGLPLAIAGKFKLPIGQMCNKTDWIISISKLTRLLAEVAGDLEVDIIMGQAGEKLIRREGKTIIKLKDQGLDEDHRPTDDFVPGTEVRAKFVILAEGADGYITEQFIAEHLTRKRAQLYSVGLKEILEVSPEQYEQFCQSTVVHALGYPLYTPLKGPGIFGGGIIYPMGQNKLAVGMIAALDWEYRDFDPYHALERFKQHRFVNKFIKSTKILEAGAKMIPEAGFNAIPRNPADNAIGKDSILLVGDCAGLVNMLQIKGLHNAIDSGIFAAHAIASSVDCPKTAAKKYTDELERSKGFREFKKASKFRQTIAKLGITLGMPLASIGIGNCFDVAEDYKVMKFKSYRHKLKTKSDKNLFSFLSRTSHREDQPCHLEIVDKKVCAEKCDPEFDSPCITFCPAGVYEKINGVTRPANPSNCLHCKTCQRKCPFDNIRWHLPEPACGPEYSEM